MTIDVLTQKAIHLLLQQVLKNNIEYKATAKAQLLAQIGCTDAQATKAIDDAFNELIAAYTGG